MTGERRLDGVEKQWNLKGVKSYRRSKFRSLCRRVAPRNGLAAVLGFVLVNLTGIAAPKPDILLPALVTNLVCRYDFEHPVTTNAAMEANLGFSGTAIHLINGGTAMRVADGAYPGSTNALQTQQVSPSTNSNDDWKAGIYQTNGVASLSNFSAVTGITLMGWVKPTGTNPNLDTTTAATNDFYNAIGLFGLLSGNSDGHAVRALLEIITVGTNYQLVALGRRIDTGNSLTLAATNDWHTLLPSNAWTHLCTTFDFDNGVMALYRNGSPIGATNTTSGNPWNVTSGTDLTSATSPAGIKIGGSFPQNTRERNAFNGRFDDLMFFNRVLTPSEVQTQFESFFNTPSNPPPVLNIQLEGGQATLLWSLCAADFKPEFNASLSSDEWTPIGGDPATNAESFSMTVPVTEGEQFFRLKKL